MLTYYVFNTFADKRFGLPNDREEDEIRLQKRNDEEGVV